VGDLLEVTKLTKSEDRPGLAAGTYADIIVYLLQKNR
jgi:hypothetical protein